MASEAHERWRAARCNGEAHERWRAAWHLPLKAIACCFKITVDEDEKEKEKNELIYGKERLDLKCEDEDDLRNMEVLSRDVTNMTGALLEGTFVDYLEVFPTNSEHPRCIFC